MRLLTKTTLAYMLIAFALLIPGGWIIHGMVEKEFRSEVDEDLMRRRQKIQGQLGRIATASPVGLQFEAMPLAAHLEQADAFRDTAVFDSLEGENVQYRQLTYSAAEGGRYYRVVLRQSLLESDDIVDNITQSIGFLLFLSLAGMLLAHLGIAHFLWKPFRRTLEAVEGFDWTRPGELALEATSTREFEQLNRMLERMGAKIRDHFANLREFTENASHELQTPLAILSAKLENLADAEDLTSLQAGEIQAMQATVGRLTRMNRALVLLSKLEGSQYLEKVSVDLGGEAERVLREHAEWIGMKGISIQIDTATTSKVIMNADLAGILVSNLVCNAIQHNVAGGRIEVCAEAHSLTLRNTGPALPTDPEKLFERFRKANQSSGSLGLGLSIARKICALSGYHLGYRYQEGFHILTVSFLPRP